MAIQITSLGASYTEDFDLLPASGSATWVNDSTLLGWYHARTGTGTDIVAGDGSSSAGNLYSFGTGTDTDRALGSVGSGNAAAGDMYWGWELANNTGRTITSLEISFTGEQWRNSAAAAQTISFSYLIAPDVTGSLAEFQSAGVAVSALDIVSPVTGGVAAAIDGNLNRVVTTFTITGLNIPDGHEIMLRWSDPDHSGANHGLAIDDVSVTASGPAVFIESFESPPGTTYTLEDPFDDGSFDFFNRYAVPETAPGDRTLFQLGWDGGFGIMGEDHDGDGGEATRTIAINDIDINGMLDPTLSVRLGDADLFGAWEAGDGIAIYATIDGGARTLVGAFAATAPISNELRLDTNGDGVGDGMRLREALENFTFFLPGTGSSLDIEIELTSPDTFKVLAVDHVAVFDTPPTPAVWRAGETIFNEDGVESDPRVIGASDGRFLAAWARGGDLDFAIFDTSGNLSDSGIADFGDDVSDLAPGVRGAGDLYVVVALGPEGDRDIITAAESVIDDQPGVDTFDVATAGFADGSYVVTYTQGTGADTDIFFRIVNPNDVVGGAVEVLPSSGSDADNAQDSEVAVLSNGNFVVVWDEEFNASTTDIDVFFRIFTPAGVPVTGANVSGAFTSSVIENEADVAALAGGGFVVVWTDSAGNGAGNTGIRATVYTDGGTVVTSDIQVNTSTDGVQNRASVTALTDGGFLVAWRDENNVAVSAQRFDAKGNKVGGEFSISPLLPASLDLTTLSDGRVVYVDDSGSIQMAIYDPRGDLISGSTGDNLIVARQAGGTIKGFDGNDIIVGGPGIDILSGGKGEGDTLSYENSSAGVSVDLAGSSFPTPQGGDAEGDTVSGFENLTGSDHGDTLHGTSASNILRGGDGGDILKGNGGVDQVFGEEGDDQLVLDHSAYTGCIFDGGDGLGDALVANFGSAGVIDLRPAALSGLETLNIFLGGFSGAGEVRINAAQFSANFGAVNFDSAFFSSMSVTLSIFMDTEDTLDLSMVSFDDFIPGDSVQIFGGVASETIVGSEVADTIRGNGGSDDMNGGGGGDTFIVDGMNDRVRDAAGGGGTDIVYASAFYALFAGEEIEVLRTINIAAIDPINLTGNEFKQTLLGNAGANVLNGLGGPDTLQGFAGSDSYVVDQAGDRIIETAGNGVNDAVYTTVNFVLRAGDDIELLRASDVNVSTPLDLTGSNLDQTLLGTNGVNILKGGGGADDHYGYAGNDIYYVDNVGDRIIETGGNGTNDQVFASADYTLNAGAHVELLRTIDAAATTGIDLTGNEVSQSLHGNAGANILDGRGGDDTLRGFAGDDTYHVDRGGDFAIEAVGQGTNDQVHASATYVLRAGNEVEVLRTVNLGATTAINLTGNEFAQTLFGNAGVNVLNGRDGGDTLRGFAGDDIFVFNEGEANGDFVVDFAGNGAAAGDRLQFSGYGAGATFAKTDATHGEITYNGGASTEVITFTNAAAVHANDVLLV